MQRIRNVYVDLAAYSLPLLLLGCGATPGEDYTLVQQPSSAMVAEHDWSIPESVVERMQACMTEHASEFKTHAHAAKFDLKVAEGADAHKVELRSSTLHHETLESCLMQSLETMSIPPSVLSKRSSEAFSGGESLRESRAHLGIAQALGGAVAAAPVILIAAGVTLAVYVVAVVTDEAIEAAGWRRKIDLACDPPYYECLSHPRQPDWNIDDFGTGKDCLSCLGECRHKKGIWPDYKCPRLKYQPN